MPQENLEDMWWGGDSQTPTSDTGPASPGQLPPTSITPPNVQHNAQTSLLPLLLASAGGATAGGVLGWLLDRRRGGRRPAMSALTGGVLGASIPAAAMGIPMWLRQRNRRQS